MGPFVRELMRHEGARKGRMSKSFMVVLMLVAGCTQRPPASPSSNYVFSADQRPRTEKEIWAERDAAIMRYREKSERERTDAAARAEQADEAREAAIEAQEQSEDPATRAANEQKQEESQKALDRSVYSLRRRDPSNPYDHGEPEFRKRPDGTYERVDP